MRNLCVPKGTTVIPTRTANGPVSEGGIWSYTDWGITCTIRKWPDRLPSGANNLQNIGYVTMGTIIFII